MKRVLVMALLVISLIIPNITPQRAYAGGAGGEALISDEVGWGIVAAMVIVGVYLVYTMKHETPPSKEQPKDKAEDINPVKLSESSIVAPGGNLIIAKW